MAKLLVLDDDQDILDYVQAGLEGLHEVSKALDGEQGLYACERNSFDLILTDIFMPFRDGFDIVREVMKLDPKSKIIAMSGQFNVGRTDYLKAAEHLGAVGSLQKPFTIEALIKTIDEALNA